MLMSMSEIFKIVNEIKDPKERQNALLQAWKQYPTIGDLLVIAFDKNVTWDLPSGAPPYKPCEQIDQHGRLHNEMRRMYIFLNGQPNKPQLHPLRRETLFVQVLESIEPDDALLLLAAKEKELPKLYKNITRKLVETTFPGILSDTKK